MAAFGPPYKRTDWVRFDDKLATVLARPLADVGARTAAWRQIVDILAQDRDGAIHGRRARQAFKLLRSIRDEVPASVRAESVLAIATRRVPAPLVALVAEDTPGIAAPLIAVAELGGGEWLELLPKLTPPARALLRHRRDLPRKVQAALDAFGASDFAIGTQVEVMGSAVDLAMDDEPAFLDTPMGGPIGEEPAPPGVDGDMQIRDLLDRIAAYRDRAEGRTMEPAAATPHDLVMDFRFETGPDGMIRWVDGAPRGPLVGIVIAVAAEQYGHGVDGHAAGAFRRRASFRDARLSVPGDGDVSGEWRISAVPFFDHHDGRFTGYRGTARRPRADEIAAQPATATGLYGSGLAPDALRQLVHELRTPLNAIVGFAEMIERQMLGPAGFDYRDRAADILDQGHRLLAAVDDLDMAARLESRRARSAATAVDAAMLIERLHDDYEAAASPRGVKLAFRVAQGLPSVDADPVAVERMFARLLAATIGLAERGETIFATLKSDAGQVRLSVSRPRLLDARDERALLDPGYSPDGDWPDAPVLGLGFALRLIRNLAVAARGGLDIGTDSFELRLPARDEAAQAGKEKA